MSDMAYIQKRKGRDGKVVYRAMVRLKGYPIQSATFERQGDAKLWGQQVEASMREGRYFKTAEAKKHTVAEMIDRYLGRIATESPKRYKDVNTKLQWWRSELGYAILSDLTKSAVIEKIDALSSRTYDLQSGGHKQISPATINRYITAFSHVCTIAMDEWEWLEQHPIQKIKKRKEPRGRVRFLDDQERESLLIACREVNRRFLYPIVVLALSTGARRSEILNLKWSDVDIKRSIITLHETKNGERRILPLAGKALKEVEQLSNQCDFISEYVFPSPTDPHKPWQFQSSWNSVVKKAGLVDFRFHDLRHSAASYLAMSGASLAEISEVLGHKTLAMVKRYAHLSEAHTASVVERMNGKIFD